MLNRWPEKTSAIQDTQKEVHSACLQPLLGDIKIRRMGRRFCEKKLQGVKGFREKICRLILSKDLKTNSFGKLNSGRHCEERKRRGNSKRLI
jgi:hypothetical protein